MVEALLNQTNLWDARKKALSTYSGGMKQRFGIAQALLANPKLIIVDEPTAGLDPAERHRFLNLLSSIGRDVIVILSTHIVEDVRELCNRMAIISNGELLLEGAPADALATLANRIWSKLVTDESELATIEAQLQVVSVQLLGGAHEVRVYSETDPGSGFRPVDPNLEDVYFLNMERHTATQTGQLSAGGEHRDVSRFLSVRVEAANQEHLDLRLLCAVVPDGLLLVAAQDFGPVGAGKVLLNGPYATMQYLPAAVRPSA